MPLYDLSEFFSLSRSLNYNLSSTSSGRYYILRSIAAHKRMAAQEKGVLMKALGLLINSYGAKKRRLGPPAVLHPLRATAILARAMENLDLLDLLTEMFHDVFEDIYPFDFGNPQWKGLMQQEFNEVLGRFDDRAGTILFERLVSLARREDESYYAYIGRMLEEHSEAAALVRVKLADRLDNTLDMRIDLSDPREDQDFFQEIFEVMFLNIATGPAGELDHPPPAPLNGAWRLYELFKNAVLLSLIRQKVNYWPGMGFDQLFHGLAVASWNEAKRVFMHVSGYHAKSVGNVRKVLMEAMEYCYSDRINMVTLPDERFRLDGLFSTYFDHTSPLVRREKLAELYRDKALMAQAAIASVVIFQSFLHDPEYYIRGISEKGISPT
ncbi:MAG: hypothetical protein AB1921_10945 [Thermodesulfobacteriota bacterium]